MFFNFKVARGLLFLFSALFLLEVKIEEHFNFSFEYFSNPKLFSKYFSISTKRGD
jgi:hypothetical protein